jgi:hypothetical protein
LNQQYRHHRLFVSRTFRKGGTQEFLLRLALVLLLLAMRPALAANFYAGISPTNVPWPGGMVPYEFTNTLSAAEQQTYLNGLREWELAGNVQFIPHTTQTNWILFCYNTNFVDYVAGGSYNPQVITISSLSRAQVCHEMGHSFGFNHENIRTNAATYLTVLTNNITNEPANIIFFTIDPTTVSYGNYDYESVMHLGWDFASINPGVLATQQPKPPYFPEYQFRMGNYCLSPGDRAALAYLYGPPAVPLTNIVTTTSDVGPGSLRAAIYYATDHPGATVRFNIPVSDPGYSNGVFNIHLTGMLPPLVVNGTIIDGSTQPGFAGRPLIAVDASQIIPETFTSDTFLIYSASNQIKNISFSGYDWNGMTLIYANATNNIISGCWFGLDPTGTNAAPNAFQGILIAAGASGNIIGGTNALQRNVISGNAQYGIFITDSNTIGNVVEGNYIGTDPSGSNAVPNGLSGIFIGNGTSGNLIGGTNAATRNVLSGNSQYGVWLSDTNTTENVIEGNYIGTDASGSNALANGLSGIFIGGGTSGNLIGGTSAAARNVLSGNSQYGIWISNTVNNVISGNYFGLNAGGETALGNQDSGIGLFGGSQNLIGGSAPGAGNVLSGNLAYGIDIANPVAAGNWIEGNLIGLDAAGTNGIGNGIGFGGILLGSGATSNIIGGTISGAHNVISGNDPAGVFFAGTTTSGNVVEGNYIGTDITGTNAVPNSLAGIYMPFGTPGNLIGGATAAAGNVISGNYYGVYLANENTASNWFEGNNVGADATGVNPLPNYEGFIIFGGATNNIIGLKPGGVGLGNQIAFNDWDGVVVGDPITAGISLRGNSIFGNGNLGIDVINSANNLQSAPAITNAFGYSYDTIITGMLNSPPGQAYLIDFYRTPTAGDGQGQFYLGAAKVTTSGSGTVSFSYTNTAGNYSGQYLTATATDPFGDTSDFSSPVLATNAPAPAIQFKTPFRWLTNGFVLSLAFATNFSYHIQAATNLAANPVQWVSLTNFTATNASFLFTDRTANAYHVRFYRVVSP